MTGPAGTPEGGSGPGCLGGGAVGGTGGAIWAVMGDCVGG